MTNKSTEWHVPLSPWEIIQRRFFAGQVPDAATFAQKHGLNEAKVRQVFTGEVKTFSPEICSALSRETEMSVQFYANLSNQHQRMAA